jgi:hypothetical protein
MNTYMLNLKVGTSTRSHTNKKKRKRGYARLPTSSCRCLTRTTPVRQRKTGSKKLVKTYM